MIARMVGVYNVDDCLVAPDCLIAPAGGGASSAAIIAAA
jgi:hypothetical protein